MTRPRAVITGAHMVTPFGLGIEICWRAIMENRTAVAPIDRFATAEFTSDLAATVPGLSYHEGKSLVEQMLEKLFFGNHLGIPADARLILATTKGEIDFLEQHILTGAGMPEDSSLCRLLAKVRKLSGVADEGMTLSAACTSSSAAAAEGSAMIRRGEADCVLVVSCDSVTEFIYSGFSSLMALDRVPARPFDRNRGGLSLGEAAAGMVIMSRERALREQREILGELAGWGLADDANHMTGPSRESSGLIAAIRKSLAAAAVEPDQVSFISAHGTGTSYNDAMEMQAFRAVFTAAPVPVYSIKGAVGHTMGSAGLLEIMLALVALQEGRVPPTVNLCDPDQDATGWVSTGQRVIDNTRCALVANAGFSGVNTALVLKR